jgi:hypothetical protein
MTGTGALAHLALATMVVGVSSPAPRAADLLNKTAPGPPSPWDLAFGSALMNDYNFRGISASARGPSLTVYLEPRYKPDPTIEFYIGLAGTSIDIPNHATAQLFYYAGIRPTVGALAFDFGISYTDYPGGILFNGIGLPTNCTNGAFFFGQCNISKAVASFWEGYAKIAWTASDAILLGGGIYYAPSWYNSGASGTYGSVTAKVTLPDSIVPKDVGASLSGELGRYWLGTTDAFYGTAQLPDYTTWNVGLTFTYKAVALDLRYYDTGLSRVNCNALTGDHTATFGGASAVTPINPSGLVSNWCSAAFIAKLSFDATMAGLK